MTDQSEDVLRGPVVGGRYALGKPIGHGGMANVFRAVDQVLHRDVAVKLLRDRAAGEADRERFKSEARTLAGLSHPALVAVLDAGMDLDQPFLVMELIEGPTLADCCAGTSVEIAVVASVGAQLAEALAHVHRAGIVHRDVKPGNVLLGTDGRTKLADFGIARLMGDVARHTRPGTTIGSPAYLSPEQVSGDEVAPSSDIYSLGLVLLEALTGQPAYPGSSVETAFARLRKPPPIPDGLPDPWRDLLAAMTSLSADDRPGAEEVASRLRELAGDTSDADTTQKLRVLGTTRVLPTQPPPGPRPASPQLTGRQRRATGQPWFVRLRAQSDRREAIIVSAAVATLVLLFALAAVVDDGSGEDGDRTPQDVPAQVEGPLEELHDAVHRGAE